jgi:large subunit ribosomal protein L24
MKIRTGDQVMVIAGKDKGRTGRVKSVDRENNRVVVEGVNMIKRHQKATQIGQPSGIIEREAPLHASNVMLTTKDGLPTRIGSTVNDDGKRVRVARRTGEVLG